MTKSEGSEGRMMITSSGSEVVLHILRLLGTLLVVLGIVLIAGFFAARTEGARELVEDRLSKLIGVPVSVARVRIGLPYVLILDGVQTDGFGLPERGGVKIQEMSVAPCLAPVWSVKVLRCEARITQQSDGLWSPSALAGVGRLQQGTLADIARATSAWRQRMRLALKDSLIRWDADGREALAAGIDFNMRPASIPGRRGVTHFVLSVRQWSDLAGREGQDEHREWLAWESEPYVELARRSGDPGSADRGFWSVERRPGGNRAGNAGAEALPREKTP